MYALVESGYITKIFTYPTVERNNLIYAWYHPHGDEPHYEVETYPEITDP